MSLSSFLTHSVNDNFVNYKLTFTRKSSELIDFVNILSFIAVMALALTLVEGFFIIFRDYKSANNRLFLLICLSISLWHFGGAFGYSARTAEEGFFWLKVCSPGYIFLHAFVLHFTLRHTGFFRTNWLYLLYLPSFYFLYVSLSDHIVFSEIYRSGEYWVLVPDYNNISFYMLITNYLVYYIVSLVLLYIHMKSTVSIRIQKQSRLIFIALVITVTSFNIEPFLAPIFFDYLTYGQAPIYSIAWISLIWYAMIRYRFLGVYEKFLLHDVLYSLHEMVIITDGNKRVFRINRALREKLETRQGIYSLEDIFVEYNLVHRLLDSIEDTTLWGITLNLRVSEGKISLVEAALSIFQDRFGDTVGFLITARMMREQFSLLGKNNITHREYQLIQLVLAGNSNRDIAASLDITLRTVETHITNIFNKLGVNRRIELINYCGDLFSSPSDS